MTLSWMLIPSSFKSARQRFNKISLEQLQVSSFSLHGISSITDVFPSGALKGLRRFGSWIRVMIYLPSDTYIHVLSLILGRLTRIFKNLTARNLSTDA